MQKRILIVIGVMLLTIFSLSGCMKKNEMTEAQAQQEKVIAVEIDYPKLGDISQSVTISGKLQPIHSVTVIPEVTGLVQIQEVRVALGDMVKKGDVLFILDNESIQDQIENLRLAYETALKNYEKVKESIENAKVNLERSKQLYEEGAISEQQYEQAKLAASDTQLAVLEAQLEQSRFAYVNAAGQLENTIVTAPIDGVVSSLHVQEKEMVSAQPALTITDISSLEVEIHVTEEMIHKIQQGQEVELDIPSIGKQKIKGIVRVINPVPDPVTQLYTGKIEVQNPDQSIRPGMFVKIFIDINKKDTVVTVPSVAVIQEEDKYFVYVVEGNQAVKREVQVGLDNGEIIEITSGIKSSDKVIVKGQDFVKDGSKVKVVRGENK